MEHLNIVAICQGVIDVDKELRFGSPGVIDADNTAAQMFRVSATPASILTGIANILVIDRPSG